MLPSTLIIAGSDDVEGDDIGLFSEKGNDISVIIYTKYILSILHTQNNIYNIS
jgi:hypothetical protein